MCVFCFCRRALLNIRQLLRVTGGDCLLVFLANNPIYDVYMELAKTEKWRDYMCDVQQFISPLHSSSDPGAEFSKLLEETGFVDFTVEIRNEIYVYDGTQNVKGWCISQIIAYRSLYAIINSIHSHR